MSPTLNGSSVIWHFECGNVIEIHDGITFNFYMGLPHIHITTTGCCNPDPAVVVDVSADQVLEKYGILVHPSMDGMTMVYHQNIFTQYIFHCIFGFSLVCFGIVLQ